MATPHASPAPTRIARFGVFEANLGTGELRKNGARISLQERPFHLLVLLLERPGDVIGREKITKKYSRTTRCSLISLMSGHRYVLKLTGTGDSRTPNGP